MRQAIPASHDDSSGVKDAYAQYENDLITKANGTPPTAKTQRRFTASKSNTKKPVRRAPQPAK